MLNIDGVMGAAEVVGATPGSQTLRFVPRGVRPGEYRSDIGC